MFQSTLKSRLAVSMAICLLFSWSLAYAESSSMQEDKISPEILSEEPTGEGMVADFVFLRPIGIAATVLGTVLFVASLPFTLPTKSVNQAAKKLVVAPARYTFVRPLGQPLAPAQGVAGHWEEGGAQ